MYTSILAHTPGLDLESTAYMTVCTCADDQSPFSDGLACREHSCFTIDRDKLAEFFAVCEASGRHPALLIQEAIGSVMDTTIAAATRPKTAASRSRAGR